jgi:hypothetical protein
MAGQLRSLSRRNHFPELSGDCNLVILSESQAIPTEAFGYIA